MGAVTVSDASADLVAAVECLFPTLPEEVRRAWREARSPHAVAAYTAAEIMCRNLLMHLAVDVARSTAGKKFVEYVDDLEKPGFVTPSAKPVVDKGRDRGNTASHELPASTETDSFTTIRITEHLLRTIYELPRLVPSP